MLAIADANTPIFNKRGDSTKSCMTHLFYAMSNGLKTAIRVIASSNIGDNMLITYQDFLKFNAIHVNFPYEAPVKADVMAELKHDFRDVLNDALNPKPMKTPHSMHINLKEKPKPLKVLAARRVPKRFEQPAEDIIQDLINKDILAQASDTTDWCSPGFFVPKTDGRVRLVTDLTHLNRYVKRPVHPFPSTRDILQSIPHDAVYFLNMDAVHGYFQLALSKESPNLTAVLLQQGKFKNLLAPMGLNASAHEWCCHSDQMVIGLPWAKKIMDDTII